MVVSSYEALGLLDKMIIWLKVNFGDLTVFFFPAKWSLFYNVLNR